MLAVRFLSRLLFRLPRLGFSLCPVHFVSVASGVCELAFRVFSPLFPLFPLVLVLWRRVLLHFLPNTRR